VVITLRHRGPRADLFGNGPAVQLGTAVVDHAAQSGRRVDPAHGPIDGPAVATIPSCVALRAAIFAQQQFADLQAGVAKQRVGL
jgi:predicted GNAT family acetyltransferase